PDAETVRPGACALPHAGYGYLDCGLRGGSSGGNPRYWNAGGPVQHRHVVCVRAGLDRRDYPALPRPGTASRIPGSRRPGRAGAERFLLRASDVRLADPDLAALLCLAVHRADHLLVVQPAP